LGKFFEPFETWGTILDKLNHNNVKRFGAKCDLAEVIFGVAKRGSKRFSATDGNWTSTDVGKTIGIVGAGDAGTDFVTTIAAVSSPKIITLSEAPPASMEQAQAIYGTDDTIAYQNAVDTLHAEDGTVYVPAPGSLLLSTIFLQTSRKTSGHAPIWKRLKLLGDGVMQSAENGKMDKGSSNLFKPTPGPMFSVNLNADGVGMTSNGSKITHLFHNLAIDGISFNGLPTVEMTPLKGHCSRLHFGTIAFLNVWRAWDFCDPDANGAPNYSDQWTMDSVFFVNIGDRLFRQRGADGTDFRNLRCEVFQKTASGGIYLEATRGAKISTPLLNKLSSGILIEFYNNKNCSIEAGHFERIGGQGVKATDSPGTRVIGNDFFHPSASAALSAHTVHFTGSTSGEVSDNSFAHARESGYDVLFSNVSNCKGERNRYYNEAYEEVSPALRFGNFPDGGSDGSIFGTPHFVRLAFDGVAFRIFNQTGHDVTDKVGIGLGAGPSFDYATGRVNLDADGAMRWGKTSAIIPVQIEGKLRPVLYSPYAGAAVSFVDDSGVVQTAPSAAMECWLLLM
jgi:hypothetical protein